MVYYLHYQNAKSSPWRLEKATIIVIQRASCLQASILSCRAELRDRANVAVRPHIDNSSLSRFDAAEPLIRASLALRVKMWDIVEVHSPLAPV